MDRLEAMEAFVVAVDRGSLSSAARFLGRSITAISRALTALEGRLGVQLLRRTSRALRLTDAGVSYLEVCRRVLGELAEADRAASSGLEAPQGVLTVTAPILFGALHVRPIVDSYLTAHPRLRARLLLLDRVVNVIDEGVDAAVRIAHLPDSALIATALGSVHRVVCASPKYLARHGRPSVPRALAEHRCINLTPLTPNETWLFGRGPGGRATQVKIEPVLTVNTAQAAVGSATDGHGVACVLSYQVADAIRARELVPLLTEYAPEAWPVHLVHPARSTASAKVRTFVELATPALRAALGQPTKARLHEHRTSSR
jgi:DNA-binding transcriptional LysR family regulator